MPRNFKAFQKSKKILVNKEDIRTFFKNQLTIPYDEQPRVYKLHVYDNSYYIEELPDGTFQTHIETTEPQGTLIEMEKVLWNWVNPKK